MARLLSLAIFLVGCTADKPPGPDPGTTWDSSDPTATTSTSDTPSSTVPTTPTTPTGDTGTTTVETGVRVVNLIADLGPVWIRLNEQPSPFIPNELTPGASSDIPPDDYTALISGAHTLNWDNIYYGGLNFLNADLDLATGDHVTQIGVGSIVLGAVMGWGDPEAITVWDDSSPVALGMHRLSVFNLALDVTEVDVYVDGTPLGAGITWGTWQTDLVASGLITLGVDVAPVDGAVDVAWQLSLADADWSYIYLHNDVWNDNGIYRAVHHVRGQGTTVYPAP